MIKGTKQVWTKRGWRYPGELMTGDTVISFNPARNCTEYDTIQSITTEFTHLKELKAIKFKNVRMWITGDHPLILFDQKTRETRFVPIQDQFGRKCDMIISRGFEPYKVSSDIEDIRWSARHCAVFSRSTYLPDYSKVWSIIEEFSCYEAREWLQEFYRWNVLIIGSIWQKSALLRNKDIREIIFHVAPRAGVGFTWWPLINSNLRAARITTISDGHLTKMAFGQRDYTGPLFNIKTTNGNALMKYRQCTFLVATEMGG